MLSTPPAFILSQDQTLVKSVCPVQNNSGHFKPLDCFLQSVLLFFGNLHFWRCSLKIYKKFSGMVYDSVFNVLLSCRQSSIDDPRTIRCFFFCCYQQLLYLITDSSICQQLFYLFLLLSFRSVTTRIWYHVSFRLSTTFFIFYYSAPTTICTTRQLSFSLWLTLALSDSLYIIIHNFTFVNNFFILFLKITNYKHLVYKQNSIDI